MKKEKEKGKSPAFQFYPNDWLSSPRIALMTPAQEGAYIRLLCYDWANDGIPDNDSQLSMLSRMGEVWLNGGSDLVRECFKKHPSKKGFLTSERLQNEREKQNEWREKSRIGGLKSAESRSKSKSRVVEPKVKGGSQMVDDCLQPNGNSSSSSSSSSSILKNIIKKIENKEVLNEGDLMSQAFKTMIPPRIEMIDQYLKFKKIRGFTSDQFYDFYETKGWIVGKTKMKNWCSAINTWNRNNNGNNNGAKNNAIKITAAN